MTASTQRVDIDPIDRFRTVDWSRACTAANCRFDPEPKTHAPDSASPLHNKHHASPSTSTTMASTTPLVERPTSRTPRTRSKSPGSRLSRPTTPLRPSSRSSFRSSLSRGRAPYTSSTAPLEDLQDGFAELSDAMADLEQNFAHLQLMHESLARFSESFASFLYGLNMNAFCVDFPEVRGILTSIVFSPTTAETQQANPRYRHPSPTPSSGPCTTPRHTSAPRRTRKCPMWRLHF